MAHASQRSPLLERQRTQIGWRERINQALCGNRVIFHHVPKCGGTSLTRALMARYPTSFVSLKRLEPFYEASEALYPNANQSEILTKSVDLRWKILALHAARDVKLIYGHVPYSQQVYAEFHDRYKFITILREPVSFFISFYFWNLVERPTVRWEVERDVEKFLETERAQLWGEFFPRFFCGYQVTSGKIGQDVINDAKANISNFDVVGLLEDIPGFEARLSIILGKKVRIGHSNKGRRSHNIRDELITPLLRRKIRELCSANVDFYNFAKTKALPDNC